MANKYQSEDAVRKLSPVEIAMAKLHTADAIISVAAEMKRRHKVQQMAVAREDAARIIRDVVELLAGTVGLRVSVESVAKRKTSRKRARRKQTHGGSTISAPATAHPPKKNGLPVAKPWENPNLPAVNAST